MDEQEKRLEERRKLQEESRDSFSEALSATVFKFFLDRGAAPVSMSGCLLALLEMLVIMIDASTPDLDARLKVWDAVLKDLTNKRKDAATLYKTLGNAALRLPGLEVPPKEEMN